jgi:hypothetical protein
MNPQTGIESNHIVAHEEGFGNGDFECCGAKFFEWRFLSKKQDRMNITLRFKNQVEYAFLDFYLRSSM